MEGIHSLDANYTLALIKVKYALPYFPFISVRGCRFTTPSCKNCKLCLL